MNEPRQSLEDISQAIDKLMTRVDKELPCINGREYPCFDEEEMENEHHRRYPESAEKLCPTCAAYWHLGMGMKKLKIEAPRYPDGWFTSEVTA